MTAGVWRYASASVAGTSHERTGAPCQDASVCRLLPDSSGEPVLVTIASDGAGSASRADVGSALACSAILSAVTVFLESGGRIAEIDRQRTIDWIAELQREVRLLAERDSLSSRDYACTLLVAIIGRDSAAFAQIGDGAIVVSGLDDGDEYSWIFWPHEGEYANLTYFATDEVASERVEHELVRGSIDEVAVFTDGLQRLALHFASRTAYAPFFRPMFEVICRAPEGQLEPVSEALATFLASASINRRTDDDKTLILATRRPASEPHPAPDQPDTVPQDA